MANLFGIAVPQPVSSRREYISTLSGDIPAASLPGSLTSPLLRLPLCEVTTPASLRRRDCQRRDNSVTTTKGLSENLSANKSTRRINLGERFHFQPDAFSIPFCRDFVVYCFLAVHRAAAMNHLSADIRRQIGSQKQGDLRHVLRRAASAQGNLLVPTLLHLVG